MDEVQVSSPDKLLTCQVDHCRVALDPIAHFSQNGRHYGRVPFGLEINLKDPPVRQPADWSIVESKEKDQPDPSSPDRSTLEINEKDTPRRPLADRSVLVFKEKDSPNYSPADKSVFEIVYMCVVFPTEFIRPKHMFVIDVLSIRCYDPGILPLDLSLIHI